MASRSSDIIKDLFGSSYKEEDEYVQCSKLPKGIYLIGRLLSLCKEPTKGLHNISREDCSKIVAGEVTSDWISKNVYPMSERSVAKRLRDDYETFRSLRKVEHRSSVKSEAWYRKAVQFNERMTLTAYDIRTKDSKYEKQLEDEYGVKMTTEDQGFYLDNCHGEYIARCSQTVPRNWLKQKRRTEVRHISENEKRKDLVEADQTQSEINIKEMKSALIDIQLHNSEMYDPDYKMSVSEPENTSNAQQSNTRSSTTNNGLHTYPIFPLVKIRTGHKTFNEPLIRCLTHCVSRYKVTTNDLLGICVELANSVFGQKWSVPNTSNEDENMEFEYEDEDETDEYSENPSSENKRRRKSGDLTYVMPSRASIRNYLDDASYLNLEMVAKKLRDKGNNVITVGLDDTTKAAGHRLFDVKTDHITISGPSTERRFFTTGYVENISHSGEDGANAYKLKLQSLAILADCTVDEMKEQIDFWMTDRAGDCSTMLEYLEIDNNKVLKCCAHVVLGVDHGIDKVFRETEQRIGIEKLVDCSKILRSPSSSIHTVGLIAISKLLSPSHAAHSVSLYNEFISWMESNDIHQNGFKGFISNRFGRIAELAKIYLKNKQHILDFFDAIVDANSNKLVLAVSTFINNEWFLCATEVYSLMGELVIFPIMDLLGIDGLKAADQQAHSWKKVKSFFDGKLSELDRLREKFGNTSTGKGQLIGAVIEEVLEVLRRQLSEMDYFHIDQDSVDDIVEEKMQYAPRTNMGCESGFAKLDHQVRAAGGMTKIETHSKKTIVATNGLLQDRDFSELDEFDRRRRWKWARSSDEVRRVKKLESDFLATVRISKQLALKRKQQIKLKKGAKLLKLLDVCKMHSGPVTASSIHTLTRLNEKQLLSEIGYLRLTVAPDIRQKRRVNTTVGKFKFENFSTSELRESIKSVVKPEGRVVDNIEALLKVALIRR